MSGELQAGQGLSSHRINQRLEEHSEILAGFLHNLPNQRAQLKGHGSTTIASSPSAKSVLRVSGFAYRNGRSPCNAMCVCECHTMQTFRSPTLFNTTLGSLFAGYSGYPLAVFRRCTEPKCMAQSSSNFQVLVEYLFPAWFIAKALTFSLEKLGLNRISISLTVRRVVSYSAEVFRLVQFGDIEAIKLQV